MSRGKKNTEKNDLKDDSILGTSISDESIIETKPEVKTKEQIEADDNETVESKIRKKRIAADAKVKANSMTVGSWHETRNGNKIVKLTRKSNGNVFSEYVGNYKRYPHLKKYLKKDTR